ncbi:MAG: butyryl-CoA:acetate CoA-transferase [Candidatus Hydrogenedens sp.]|nr:butyryl-CoA:acetate CoA-transferase [Candidatus Hydrogenedentota bacterium]NLF56662.1 butyryl-CoA:acetate CoA-transferase [Candidatus Hydrogenedens sp.]
MSDIMSEYREKLVSAEEAAAMVQSNDLVDYYAFTASSRYLDAALAGRVGALENVTIRSELRLAPPFAVFMADPGARSFTLDSLFYGPIELMVPPAQRTATPAPLSFFEALFRRGDLQCDVAAIMVSPPDNEGYMHFCPSPGLARTLATHARLFFAEINESYFPIQGTEDRRIHLSEVSHVIEGDNPPMLGVPAPAASAEDQQIAAHILGVIQDGSCLQIGYGAVPDAVAALIGETELRDLGIHTEFLSDGIMRLYKAGRITGAKKTTDPGKILAGIAFGSSELYEFIRECPDLYMSSPTYSNNPGIIRQNDNFVSINAFLEIDLSGQVNAESIGTDVRSGTGGQLDFVIGAQQARDGKAILCSASTYTRKDGVRVSRILPTLTRGATVTTPRSCVQYVCTEYGMVNLRGRNLWERSERLISIAHPDFRDELIREAEAMGVWRNRNRVGGE